MVRRPPTRTPEPTDTDEQLLAALREVYGDAPSIDVDRLLAEVHDPAVPWDESLRYYFNVAAGGAEALIDPANWDALAAPGDIADGARVALGFDGSYNTDGTALVTTCPPSVGRFCRGWTLCPRSLMVGGGSAWGS